MSGAWRAAVDRDLCIGSGMCAATAPDVFRLDGGYSVPRQGDLEPDPATVDAAESCPVEAITVRDAADGRLVAPVD